MIFFLEKKIDSPFYCHTSQVKGHSGADWEILAEVGSTVHSPTIFLSHGGSELGVPRAWRRPRTGIAQSPL